MRHFIPILTLACVVGCSGQKAADPAPKQESSERPAPTVDWSSWLRLDPKTHDTSLGAISVGRHPKLDIYRRVSETLRGDRWTQVIMLHQHFSEEEYAEEFGKAFLQVLRDAGGDQWAAKPARTVLSGMKERKFAFAGSHFESPDRKGLEAFAVMKNEGVYLKLKSEQRRAGAAPRQIIAAGVSEPRGTWTATRWCAPRPACVCLSPCSPCRTLSQTDRQDELAETTDERTI